MDNLELIEDEVLPSKTQNNYLDKATGNNFENEELLMEQLSETLGRIFLATYKAKIDEVFKQMKTQLS